MVKTLVVIAASAAFSISAFAQPTLMSSEMLDQVVAGGVTDDPCYVRGDNGWGNGADGTNPGSDNGGTSLSKIAGTNQTGLDKINTNPTTSTGR